MELEYVAEIIKEAAKSRSGMIALAMMLIGFVTRSFFRNNNEKIVNFVVYVLFLVAIGTGVYSVTDAKTQVPPTDSAKVNGVTGFVYYEVGVDGGTTVDGRLVVVGDGSKNYSDLKVGDFVKATGIAEDQYVDGSYIRSKPSARNGYVIGQLFDEQCARITEANVREINVQNAASGGWLKVETATCP